MWPFLIRLVIGLLLIIHGVGHWRITTSWGTRPTASSWLLDGFGADLTRSIGAVLWVAALAVFVLAGGCLLIQLAWWRPLAVLAAAISLLTIALYWQPQMILGAAIDIGILVALLWAGWPTPELSGV